MAVNVTITLTCPVCSKKTGVMTMSRIQKCDNCGELSYLKPEQHSMFLRNISADDRKKIMLSEMGTEESGLMNTIGGLREKEREQLRIREEELRRGIPTQRILVITLIIVILSAVLLFSDPGRVDNPAVITFVYALGFITVFLMILRTVNRRTVDLKIGYIEENLHVLRKDLQAIQRKIDLTVIGTSSRE